MFREAADDFAKRNPALVARQLEQEAIWDLGIEDDKKLHSSIVTKVASTGFFHSSAIKEMS
jgi:hypothetical protein